MNAADSTDRQPKTERRVHQDPAVTHRRRYPDSLFNRLRWSVFVIAWVIAGVVLLGYLIYRAAG